VDSNERQLFGRKCCENVAGGREKRHSVYVTPEEDAVLRARAAAQSIGVPRLLFESAMADGGETSTDRKAAIATLFAIARQVSGIATNVNQLARYANTEGVFPPEAEALTVECRDLLIEIHEVIRELARP
jgi:hypothetical protein